jgi:hypothetical protein
MAEIHLWASPTMRTSTILLYIDLPLDRSINIHSEHWKLTFTERQGF